MAGGTLVSEKRVSIDGHRARRLVQKAPGAGLIYSLIVLGDHGAYYSLTAAPRSETATEKAQTLLDSFRVQPPTAKAWCHPQ